MKTFEIRIKGEAEADEEFIEAFKSAQAGKKIPSKTGVFFTSLEAVRNLLTEERLELLHMIKTRHPRSIYQHPRLDLIHAVKAPSPFISFERLGSARINKYLSGVRKQEKREAKDLQRKLEED